MALIAHYRLDGNAEDALGRHHGVASGVTWADGKLGKAGQFNGSNTYIDAGNVHNIGTKDFSIGCWIKTGSSALGWAVTKSEASASYYRYALGVYGGKFRVLIGWGDSGTHADYYGSSMINDDKFHHVAFSLTIGKSLSVYVDGIEEARFDVSNRKSDNFYSSFPFRIGAYTDASRNAINVFNGLIDDVRVYDHALSEHEVRDLANGLLSHYRLDGDITDAVGTGLISIGSGSFVSSDIGTVADVTGTLATVPLAHTPLALKGETITFLAKCNVARASVGGGAFDYRIIQWGNYYSANSGGFGLISGSILGFLRGPNGGGWTNTFSSNAAGRTIYDQGGWIRYTVVFREDDTLAVFMNSTKVADIPLSDPYTGIKSAGIQLGASMQAQVSNLRIFRTALTDDQVVRLATCRASLDSQGNFYASLIKQSPRARFIRDWCNGSTANTSNHWVEIQAYDFNGTNVALGAAAPSAILTDGVTVSSPYYALGPGAKSVTVDLGSVVELDYVRVWHYYADGRTYLGTKTEVSEDGVTWTTLFDSSIDGTYKETSEGKIHSVIPSNHVGITPYGYRSGNISEVGITRGLVAWYPLIGDTLDYAGTNNAVSNGAVATPDGYLFDGTSSLSAETAIPTSGPQTWTASAVVVLNDNTVGNQKLVDFNLGVFLVYHTVYSKKALLYLNNGVNDSYTYSNGVFPTGVPIHVSFVVDQESFVARIYLNGQLYGESLNWDPTDVPRGIVSTTKVGSGVIGILRDVRIHNVALTPEEVAIQYQLSLNNQTKTVMTAGQTFIQGQFKEVIA